MAGGAWPDGGPDGERPGDLARVAGVQDQPLEAPGGQGERGRERSSYGPAGAAAEHATASPTPTGRVGPSRPVSVSGHGRLLGAGRGVEGDVVDLQARRRRLAPLTCQQRRQGQLAPAQAVPAVLVVPEEAGGELGRRAGGLRRCTPSSGQ